MVSPRVLASDTWVAVRVILRGVEAAPLLRVAGATTVPVCETSTVLVCEEFENRVVDFARIKETYTKICQDSDYMIVVKKGSINLKSMDDKGTESIIATIPAGDIVGAVDIILDNSIRHETIVTLEDSEVYYLSMEKLKKMEQKNKKLAAQFYFNLVCMFSDHLEEYQSELYS